MSRYENITTGHRIIERKDKRALVNWQWVTWDWGKWNWVNCHVTLRVVVLIRDQ